MKYVCPVDEGGTPPYGDEILTRSEFGGGAIIVKVEEQRHSFTTITHWSVRFLCVCIYRNGILFYL